MHFNASVLTRALILGCVMHVWWIHLVEMLVWVRQVGLRLSGKHHFIVVWIISCIVVYRVRFPIHLIVRLIQRILMRGCILTTQRFVLHCPRGHSPWRMSNLGRLSLLRGLSSDCRLVVHGWREKYALLSIGLILLQRVIITASILHMTLHCRLIGSLHLYWGVHMILELWLAA